MQEDGARAEADPLVLGQTRRSRRRPRGRETEEEKRIGKILEKQQRAWGVEETVQSLKHQEFAKKQILEAASTRDLIETAENLVEENWLGKIEELPGSMFSIGAFGDLNLTPSSRMTFSLNAISLNAIKARSRFMGCIVIALVQIISPPCVFLSTVYSWGYNQEFNWKKWKPFDASNSLEDWRVNLATKITGTMLLFCFVFNGLFVIIERKETWFKLYNTFQYIKRSTPNFVIQGDAFLYLGAFVNCWTVLWCSVSSYVVVGSSDSVKDVLFDSLSLLFLYNLDEIGGALGFVDADDWPGLRLGWIFQEMVKKNWQPSDDDEGHIAAQISATIGTPCKMHCGRTSKKGFTTCCRACGRGDAPPHDDDCGKDPTSDEALSSGVSGVEEIERGEHSRRQSAEFEASVDDGYVGGEEQDWGAGGYIVKYMYMATVCLLYLMSMILPLLCVWTPFSLIAPHEG